MSAIGDYGRSVRQREELARQSEIDRQKVIDAYREVFTTETGRWVLIDMLNDLGMWSKEVETASEVVLQNYARLVLEKCGAWQVDRLPAIMAALLGDEPEGAIDVE